jgi:predicted alpha/beta hydrolase
VTGAPAALDAQDRGAMMRAISERVSETPVVFDALDGFRLTGFLFEPEKQRHSATVAIVNCGGGIPASSYRLFAKFLAESGVPTLIYDYRGIGASRPARLRGFVATVEDWAEYDCGGAISWLRGRYPDAQLTAVCHSIGTLLFGGAPNANQLARCVLICAHTGYFGDYHRRYRLPMAVLWHGVMPALTAMFGYFPGRRLRLGDDIPAGIAYAWSRRRGPNISSGVRGGRARGLLRRCGELAMPALVVSIEDDAFATAAGTSRLLAHFPHLAVEHMLIRPSELGLDRIGHFGFFRPYAQEVLWPPVLAYLMHGES